MWSWIESTTCCKCESTDRKADLFSTLMRRLYIPATVPNDLGKVTTSALKFFWNGTRYIVVHGSETGFLDGTELVFKAKSTTGDYHDRILPVDRKAADSTYTTT